MLLERKPLPTKAIAMNHYLDEIINELLERHVLLRVTRARPDFILYFSADIWRL